MNSISYDLIYGFGSFIIPGFFTYLIMGEPIGRKHVTRETSLFIYVLLGFFNLPIWSIYLMLLGQDDRYYVYSNYTITDWTVKVIIIPVITGIVLNMIRRNKHVRIFLNKLGLNIGYPIATAWEYVFRTLKSKWVIVTLKNGSEIYALMGEGSYYSVEGEEGDIYITKMYECKGDKKWREIRNSSGIWINKSDITFIEFKHD